MGYGWFSLRGRLSKTRPIAPPGYEETLTQGQAAARNKNELSEQRGNGSNEMTKRSQFFITNINPATYVTNRACRGHL